MQRARECTDEEDDRRDALAQPLLRGAVRAEHDDPAQQHPHEDDGSGLGQVLQLSSTCRNRSIGKIQKERVPAKWIHPEHHTVRTYMELVPHLVAHDHAESEHDEEDEDECIGQPLAGLFSRAWPQCEVGGAGIRRHGKQTSARPRVQGLPCT